MAYDSIHEMAEMARDELGVKIELLDGAYEGVVSREAWEDEVEGEFDWLQSDYHIDVIVREKNDESVTFVFGHPE